jgi:hypothetical protein
MRRGSGRAPWARPFGRPTYGPVECKARLEIFDGGAGVRVECVADQPWDVHKAAAPVEERGDRDLVRRVQHQRGRAAGPSRLAGQRETRERALVGRLEGQGAHLHQVERGRRAR